MTARRSISSMPSKLTLNMHLPTRVWRIVIPRRKREYHELEAIPIAKSYVTKALSLDSTLGEAWTTLGFIQSHREYDWEGSKAIFEKAIRLNPNHPFAYFYYGNVFFFNGDVQRGLNKTKRALDLDPLSTTLNFVLGRQYFHARQYDLAIKQLKKTLILDPDYPPAKIFLGLAYVQKKLYPQAIDIFAKLPTSRVEHGVLLSYGYAMAGEKARAKTELDKTLKEEGIRSPYWLAIVYIGLENFNEALTQLEKGYETREITMVGIKLSPELDPLRNEPRFKALLKKMNFD